MRNTLETLLVAAAAVFAASVVSAADGGSESHPVGPGRQFPQATVTVTDGLVTQVCGPALATGRTARASQKVFFGTRAPALGIATSQLRAEGTLPIMAGKFTLFAYRQEVNGIPVYDRWLKLLVKIA